MKSEEQSFALLLEVDYFEQQLSSNRNKFCNNRVLLSLTVSATCLATFSAVARYVTLDKIVSCDLAINKVAR